MAIENLHRARRSRVGISGKIRMAACRSKHIANAGIFRAPRKRPDSRIADSTSR